MWHRVVGVSRSHRSPRSLDPDLNQAIPARFETHGLPEREQQSQPEPGTVG